MVSLTFFQRMMSRFVPDLVEEIDRQKHALAALTLAKEEAERANQAKSEFLARMSLELRMPLNAVLSYSETLLAGARNGRGKQVAELERIQAAGKQALAMVSDILDISRIEAGRLVLHIESVDLDWLIDEMAEAAQPLAARNNNSFVLERGRDLGSLQADAGKLRQVIANLLSDAAKVTQNGQITLSVMRRGDWMDIGVAGALRSEAEAGLGLSLSQELCRMMGGEIAFESEPGSGSRFIVTLPAPLQHVADWSLGDQITPAQQDDETPEVEAPEAVGDTAEHDSLRRVLVVDDDQKFLELAERVFAGEGYVPICTDAPQSALQIARTVRPEAIFLDILMPGFDGWDVLAALKADQATAEIPVFMIAALSERSRVLAAGADGIVAKPLDTGRVKAALAGLRAVRGTQRAKAAMRA